MADLSHFRPSDNRGDTPTLEGSALLVVDVQVDFLPGGALPVPNGDMVIGPLNRYIDVFLARGLPIYASRDWHPPDHISFRDRGGPWPPHCVANTPGAAFAPGLKLPPSVEIISKGTDPAREAYSAFQGTDLGSRLSALTVQRLFVGGLATDYCVLQSVKDALHRGLETYLLLDTCRAVNVNPGDGYRAVEEMEKAGARILTWENFAG